MKHFREDEFQCQCGCGMDVDPMLKEQADHAREESDTPYVITSGARCRAHNRAVGSKDSSSHIKGLAMDIRYSDTLQLVKIIRGLSLSGFNRIGVNERQRFVHADIDKEKPDAIWIYHT